MQHFTLPVPRTAHYYTLGSLHADTQAVWLVCHGYGQLAQYFIRKFAVLDDGQQVVIAPEGLSKFYLQGFNGRVGASWMTKEDRLDEIADNNRYLDLIMRGIRQQAPAAVKIKVLGFSQGTATVCRWLAQSNLVVDQVFLWAGAFPEDISFPFENTYLTKMPVTLVYGEKDPFITPDKLQSQKELLLKMGIMPEVITFAGEHDLDAATLLTLSKK